MTAVTTSRTKASEAATGATHAAKSAAQTVAKKSVAAGKAVPKPTRAATGATASPPNRRSGAGEARRSASGPAASVSGTKKETPMTVAEVTEPVTAGVGGLPPYRAGEDPWTAEEVAELQAELEGEAARLHREISTAETGIADLLRDSGEGAGDDQADAGTKNFEREHEMSIANNAREMLQQTERALARLAAGTYGVCESCGEPVGKYRLQAFPRATLCMSCKQKQERR
jgi:DnaK suppressor protein